MHLLVAMTIPLVVNGLSSTFNITKNLTVAKAD